MVQPQLDGVVKLSIHFTSLVIFWNHAESAARQIAQELLGLSTMSMALTAELGNRTLMAAIEVASHEMGDLGSHLRHFVKGYDILLSYRNFYVNGLFALKHNGLVPGAYEGILFSQDGKGRARYFSRGLTEAELLDTHASLAKLIGYATAIQKELGVSGPELQRLHDTYGASLEKPNWPRAVEKTPLYLQGQEPLPPTPSRKRGTRQKSGKP